MSVYMSAHVEQAVLVCDTSELRNLPSRSLAPRWSGPHQILAVVNNVVAVLRSDFKHQLGLPEKVKLLGIDRFLPVPKGMHWEQINCLASFTREARDPFAEPGGLYSAEEVDGADEKYLREWSILTGTPPAFLLTPREASPPASAASSAHTRLLPSPGIAEAAMQGVESLLRGSIRACIGRAMSAVEQLILTLCLCAGNLYAVCMLASRLVSMVAHLCGCLGTGSQQTWQEGLQWACCDTVNWQRWLVGASSLLRLPQSPLRLFPRSPERKERA